MGAFSELGIEWSTLITQIVAFGILLVLLYIIAYKPIMRILDERARRIKEGLEQAEAAKKMSAEAEEMVKARLEEASRESQERLARAIKAAEEMKQKAREDARKEAEALIERARQDIWRERMEAVDAVRREFADLTVLAAGKVIEKTLDKEEHLELIEKVLEESLTDIKE